MPQPLEAEFFCASCRTPFVESYPLDEHGLCPVCRSEARSFDSVYAFGGYEGSLQELIHLFKYGKVESLAAPLSELLLRALPRELDFDQVFAVPMHWRKKWERGFNQAELLAAPVAKRFGVKLSSNLRRRRYTSAQAGLDEQRRRKNLTNAFAVRRPAQLAGKRILLVDDVFTTGATLRAAASVLKKAGAAHISVLTLARVDRRVSFEGPRELDFASSPAGRAQPPASLMDWEAS